jgi:hypothetical protein
MSAARVGAGSHTPPHRSQLASGWPEGRVAVGARPQPASATWQWGQGPGAGRSCRVASASPQAQQKVAPPGIALWQWLQTTVSRGSGWPSATSGPSQKRHATAVALGFGPPQAGQ